MTTLAEEAVARARESERAVLGCVLLAREESTAVLDRVLAIAHHDDFFSPAHRLILGAMLRLRDAGKPQDPALLRDDLEQHGELVAAGGPALLGSLLDGGWVSANVEHHARAVHEAAEKRTKQETLSDELAALGPQPEQQPDPKRRWVVSEVAMAERLVREHGRDLRNLHGESGPGPWLVWAGMRWRVDDEGEVVRRATDTIRAMTAEANEIADDDQRKAVLRKLLAYESHQHIIGTVRLAASAPGVPVRHVDLDHDPWLLGVQNGAVDLRTGELRQPTRGDLITKQAGCAYDPEAKCPQWEAFLDRIMAGNQDLVGFLQRITGHALTGDTSEDVLFVFHGTGANGKSTLLRALLDLAGDYGKPAAKDLLLAKRDSGHTTDLADLRGARLVTVMETDEGRRLAEAEVKSLTGGDPVKARFLYQDNFTFEPTWKLFLACNHLPKVRGTDRAIWRRIKRVPFTVTIPDEEQESREVLRARFRAEQPGILRWAVEGCLAWQLVGLREPEEVRKATADYRAAEDTLAAFLEEECVLGPNNRVPKGALFARFADWAKRSGEAPLLSKRDFGNRLRERGHDEAKLHDGHNWLGVGLRQPGTTSDDQGEGA
jgi:putative DNA primase/helicase